MAPQKMFFAARACRLKSSGTVYVRVFDQCNVLKQFHVIDLRWKKLKFLGNAMVSKLLLTPLQGALKVTILTAIKCSGNIIPICHTAQPRRIQVI